jgi:NADPH:quinone reductase-like Zn-dependent oxidoreductase
VIGVLSGPASSPADGIDVRTVLSKSIYVCGTYVGSRAMFERMNAAFAANHLKPVIDRTFPVTEAKAALAHMQNGSHFGKVVLALKP